MPFLHQDPATPRASPAHSPPENGIDKPRPPKKDTPNSPASVASSGSTPSSKAKELSHVSRRERRTNWDREDLFAEEQKGYVCGNLGRFLSWIRNGCLCFKCMTKRQG